MAPLQSSPYTELSPCNLTPARTSIASALLQEARNRPAAVTATDPISGDNGTDGSPRRHEVRRDAPRAERLQFVIDVLDAALAIPFDHSLHATPSTAMTSWTGASDE
jgi:hypothetical protein